MYVPYLSSLAIVEEADGQTFVAYRHLKKDYMDSQLLIIGSLHKCNSKLKNQCVYCLFSRLPIAGHCQSMSSIISSAVGTETFLSPIQEAQSRKCSSYLAFVRKKTA